MFRLDKLSRWDVLTVPEVSRGRYMGTALYYPALEVLGLVDTAGKCFRLSRSEVFGVRAVMLTLFFLTLLSQTTVETAKHLRRFEFGPAIGAGRAPAVKTLRRKLAELVRQNGAGRFQGLLVKRRVDQAVVTTACLYVDGHMKMYSGKRKLAECWNTQRQRPLPGVLTHFVSDIQGRPLLFVTEEADVTLAKAMPKEEWLLERLAPHCSNSDGIRLLLRSFAELSGEVRRTAQGMVITLDPPDTPIYRRALRGLCADLSQLGATFPRTDLPVTYQVAMHHSERAA